jgi:predicted RNase H-like nuclease (RuvC/YqgF family)
MGAITWRKTGVCVLVALPVLGLAGIGVLARQQQQDASQQSGEDAVAAAARKAREQKKEAPKPKKVYTNEDVSSAPAAAAPTAASSDKTAPAADGAAKDSKTDEGADGDKTPKNKNDEASWRKRFTEARDKLAVAEKELDILQREVNKAQTQYYSDPQKALSEQYSRKSINDHDTQIAAKKQEVEQLKQNLSNLEDELRRSGGDIGWAR